MGQARDGLGTADKPIHRADDFFIGSAANDPKPDWVDQTKIRIPQADEQQRMLVNLVEWVNTNHKPLPHFWYLPHGYKAAIVMTGDDHGHGGTSGRFDQYLAASPTGCSVEDWTCIRSSSYIYPYTPLTDAQAKQYTDQGFEIGIHVNTGCTDWTPTSFADLLSAQHATFTKNYPSLPPTSSNRTHCVVWSDWSTTPKVLLANGIRLDTTYYYYPAKWAATHPGYFTGSGMPMRLTDLDGTPIDVYEAATELSDESGQAYPYTVNTLLDGALGPDGYYGVIAANFHTDYVKSASSDVVVSVAKQRHVPVVSGRQMLTWLDGRNGSTITGVGWSANTLGFDVAVASGARGLQIMLPAESAGGSLKTLTANGTAVELKIEKTKGVAYARVDAVAGHYSATYG